MVRAKNFDQVNGGCSGGARCFGTPEFPEYAWSNDGGNNDKLVKIVYLQKLTEFPAATTTTVYVQCISIAT